MITKLLNFVGLIDYPMYHYDEKEKKIDFSHNPFSMPQVEISDFDKQDPLEILAYQYDLVCNGYELIFWGNQKPYTRIFI